MHLYSAPGMGNAQSVNDAFYRKNAAGHPHLLRHGLPSPASGTIPYTAHEMPENGS